jgi:hypothetical protein
MAACDNCGRAVLTQDATTFPNSTLVLCGRSGCESVADLAKDLYYTQDVDAVREEVLGR